MPAIARQNQHQHHLHLTNSIHVKNHLHHYHHPMDSDQHLMRDLALLQRARSLRDPPTSFSPSELNNGGPIKPHGSRSEIGRLEMVPDRDLTGRVWNGRSERKKGRKKKKRCSRVSAQPVCSDSSDGNDYSLQDVIFGDELGFGDGDSANVCGFPFSWSRVHSKGKNFLSCGLSDWSKGGKIDGPNSQIRGKFDNLKSNLNSCTSSDSVISPFFVGAGVDSYLKQRFSGELGIFSSNRSFEIEIDSDLGSEAKSVFKSQNRRKSLTLTERYTPKSFKDVIGQNLVVQALSNAIIKRKIGLIYLFHGSQGVGKSSIAKIFAKSLNCTSVERNIKPCDLCDSCVSHNNGRNKNIIHFGPINSEKVGNILQNFNLISSVSSQYKVLIFDECDSLKAETWAHICKSIENSTKKMVFIFTTNNNNINMPHGILSRSQKFFFAKIKETDIANYLNYVCNNEGLNADRNALKLIAVKSDGSLRDALMIVDQLSLLGQKIDLCTVQELIGVLSEEKLLDLLDPALSGRTANTVKVLRELLENGVDPTALMSQLAAYITDVLAGAAPLAGPDPPRVGHRRFFRHDRLGREETERLRRALRVLSEAEKQLRASNDKITWLTASLLQLAPDKFYMNNSTPLSPSSNRAPQIVKAEIEEIVEEELCVAPCNGSRNRNETGQRMRNGSRNDREKVGLGERNGSRNEREKVGLISQNGSRKEREMGETGQRKVGLVLRNGSRNERETGEMGQSKVGLVLRNGSRNERETGEMKVGVALRNRSRNEGETGRNMSLVKGKVSLAQVISRFEGSGGWSKQKAISIAEKLEKQNLRLESQSRRLFCWRAPRVSKAKIQKLKIKVLKRNLVICTRGCLCAKDKSP